MNMNIFDSIHSSNKNSNVEANERSEEEAIKNAVDKGQLKRETLNKNITQNFVVKNEVREFQIGNSSEAEMSADDTRLHPDGPDYEGNLEHPAWDGFKPN